VENGAGTGWTVDDMLFALIFTFVVLIGVQISLDAGNSSTRNWLLIVFLAVVIMSVTRGQFAWVIFYVLSSFLIIMLFSTINSSETTRETFSSKRTVEANTKDWFQQWLVGVTDGDGSFTFSKSNGKWTLFYKVSQSTYNLRLLHHIKSQMGVGSVQVEGNNDMADYRLRSVTHIVSHLLPIFDKYSLLTSKYYYYDLFKQAALILANTTLTTTEKDILLTELKTKRNAMPEGYISPAWSILNYTVKTVADALRVVSKPWVVGFTETEGSFYLFIKDKSNNRMVHAFELVQKLDKIVLDAVALILGVNVREKKTHNTLYVDSIRMMPTIIEYYTNTMKGMKSLEFRIWARSFNKMTHGSKGFDYFNQTREQLHKIRSIRLNTQLKLSHYKTPRSFNSNN